jgi:cobalt-precorrin 5A hydrolase
MQNTKIAIVTINQPSLNSACKLVSYLDGYEYDVYGKKDLEHNLENLIIYDKLDDILKPAWKKYDAIICILAMGAVVRKIAPLLEDKSTDPAVIVINLALDKIVPLLSGHLGGANELSNDLTNRLPKCINFISTATDQTNTIAFDMIAKQNSWKIENIDKLANISNRLLNKKQVNVLTKKAIFDSLPKCENINLITPQEIDENTVIISPVIEEKNLTLKPKVYLGIGCNRGTSFKIIDTSVKIFLAKYNLSIDQIQNIASFEVKQDEEGLLQFANKYNFDIEFYKKEDINALEDNFSPSASTKFFDLKGVAEPSAILCSQYKELIVKKQVYNKSVTISAAI